VNPTAGDRMDSVRRSASCAALLAALVLALSAAPAQPLVPTPVRLRDAVGDTIDAAERDSFRLFPNTAGFRQAVILALPGPEFFAEVTITTADTSRFIYYRILPNQLERIRFLIDNPSFMAEQLERDPNAELAFNYFWKAIEQNPLKSIGGPPANLPEPDASGTPLENKERPSYGRRGGRPPRRHSRTGRDTFASSGSSVDGPLSLVLFAVCGVVAVGVQ